jgi:Protein of unknown function (DUF3667)
LTRAVAWTCPTCKTGVETPFCSGCGERRLRVRDLTLRGFVAQIFEAFTNVDSKLVRSFHYLIARPGRLTVAFLQGERQPFLRPVPLFLIANVLFFAIEALSGGTLFTTPLDWHLHRQPWSGFAPQLVADRLAALHTTLEQYSPVFDRAVATKARSLIIFMALLFALVPMLVFMRRKRPVVAHAVFSLHLYSFMLLLFSVVTVIPALSALMGGPGFESSALDYTLSVSLLAVCALYLFYAVRAVYDVRGVARVISTLVLMTAVGAIVLGYRFFLFIVTLYTT